MFLNSIFGPQKNFPKLRKYSKKYSKKNFLLKKDKLGKVTSCQEGTMLMDFIWLHNGKKLSYLKGGGRKYNVRVSKEAKKKEVMIAALSNNFPFRHLGI